MAFGIFQNSLPMKMLKRNNETWGLVNTTVMHQNQRRKTMIVEITTYKPVDGVTHEELVSASKEFDKNYCARCKGLISRHFLKIDDGYMDIFNWESKADVEHVQAIFMQDTDALAFAKYLDSKTLTM